VGECEEQGEAVQEERIGKHVVERERVRERQREQV